MRSTCIVCGAPLFDKPLYVCKNMPATSQNLLSESDVRQRRGKGIDFNLCQCSGCGLVQFDCDPVPYYRDSTRAGERCEALIKLRRAQYKHLIETYGLQGKKILEVGAGKGGFLKTLKEMTEYKIREYGIENNPEFVRIANEVEGVNVQRGFIDAPDFSIQGAPFDAFLSFAFPARLIEPNEMLRGVYHNLKDDAVGLVMVPSLEHLLEPGGFFDITADHIAYYSEDTLRFLLQKNGFDVIEHGKVSKLYNYAIVRKRPPCDVRSAWSDVEPLARQVRDFVDRSTQGGKKLAVWCAGHFAFTVLSVAQIGDKVSYIIDNARFKQGFFAPASYVPIVGPEHFRREPVHTILILGPIYVDELVREIRAKCSPGITIAAMDKNELRIWNEAPDGE